MKNTVKVSPEEGRQNDKLFQFIIFKLAGEDYGIHIEHVREVTKTPKISRMPKTPSFIKGVANVRGDLIAIIDLEERFQLKPLLQINTFDDGETYTIVVDAGTYNIGFVVKELPSTINLPEAQIDKSADVIEKAKFKNKFIIGLGKMDGGRLVVLLDIFKIMTKIEINKVSSINKIKS